jgi:hypothetical protein
MSRQGRGQAQSRGGAQGQKQNLERLKNTGRKQTQALSRNFNREEELKSREEENEPRADPPEPPEQDNLGSSEASLSPDGENPQSDLDPLDGPPGLGRVANPDLRRMAVRFAISKSGKISACFPPRLPGRVHQLRKEIAEAIALHVCGQDGWQDGRTWLDVPVLKFSRLLELVKNDAVRSELGKRDKSQGKRLKNFAIALPDGKAIAVSSLIFEARENKVATRAAALRLEADRPPEVASESWSAEDWTGFEEAQSKAARIWKNRIEPTEGSGYDR